MKILQIAPIFIPLNSRLKYGGIERVVLSLARAFFEKGHSVITAAPADSDFHIDTEHNYGDLLPTINKSEWTKPRLAQSDPNSYENHINKVINFVEKSDIDVIHDHTGNFVLSDGFKQQIRKVSKLQEILIVVTPHEFKRFKKIEHPKRDNIIFTALSKYQKKIFSHYVNIEKVITNGLFVDEYPFETKKENYLFSIGSIEKAKGQDIAVRVASETGLPLKIAGPIADRDFYDLEIRPHLRKGCIEYIGQVNDTEKKEIYKKAIAVIAPIRIGDCFSLVRIEPLACGTPCITLDTGSAQEAIRDKKTGYIVPYKTQDDNATIKKMAEAIKNIKKINPNDCRRDVEERFDWRNIADEYLRLYEK